jgi:hypothetical protein
MDHPCQNRFLTYIQEWPELDVSLFFSLASSSILHHGSSRKEPPSESFNLNEKRPAEASAPGSRTAILICYSPMVGSCYAIEGSLLLDRTGFNSRTRTRAPGRFDLLTVLARPTCAGSEYPCDLKRIHWTSRSANLPRPSKDTQISPGFPEIYTNNYKEWDFSISLTQI